MESDDLIHNFGVEGAINLWGIGELGFDYASSKDKLNNNEAGHAWQLSYSFLSGSFNFSAMAREQSADYFQLNRYFSNQKLQSQRQLSAGYYWQNIGGINLRYRDESYYSEPKSEFWELGYNKSFGGGVNLQAVYRRETKQSISSNTFGLRFSWSLANSTTTNYSYNHAEASEQHVISLQNSNSAFGGSSYRAQLVRNEHRTNGAHYNGFVGYEYRGSIANYRANYRYSDNGQDSMSLQMAGALSFLKGNFNLSRPIFDSFALVDVGVEDVDIKANNILVGATNEDGVLLVPNMSSYYATKIMIDANDVPVDHVIKKTEGDVSTYYRSGKAVSLRAEKSYIYWGKIFIRNGSETKPALYKGLKIFTEKGSSVRVLSKQGEFYFEDLKPGKYKAEIFSTDYLCNIELNFPETDNGYFDLGELVCESQ